MAFVYADCPPEFKTLMNQIFSEDFIRENTRFSSFEGFRYSSAVFVNWNADEMVYDEAVFDNFVKESTRFSTWDEMVRTAADLRFKPADNQK